MSERSRERLRGASPEVPGGARLARRRSPLLAAVLAILIPGAGHLYAGRRRAAAAWLAAILIGYWAVFLPGAVLHALSVWSAYRAAWLRTGPGRDPTRSEGGAAG